MATPGSCRRRPAPEKASSKARRAPEEVPQHSLVPPTWEFLSGVERITSNSLIRAVFIENVRRALDATLPPLIAREYGAGAATAAPLPVIRPEHVDKVFQLIENYRLARRGELLEPADLDEVKYGSEQNVFNTAVLLFQVASQCLVLHKCLLREHSQLAAIHFPHLYQECQLMVQRTMPVCRYPVSVIRLAVLKLIRHWHALPLQHPEFIVYLRLLRFRAAEIQSMVFDNREVVDFPDWTTVVARQASTTFYRVTLHFARDMDIYFYHLNRVMEHSRSFIAAAKPWDDERLGSEADLQIVKDWLVRYQSEVFLEQWQREVVTRALLICVLPTEREVFKWANPQSTYDQRAVIQFFRRQYMEEVTQLNFAPPEQLMKEQPLVGGYYRQMFLLQTVAESFQLDPFVMWHTDLPTEADGSAYPEPSFFSRLAYPVIYIPQCWQHLWIINGTDLYDCGEDIDKAFCAWLKLALISRGHESFEKLRTRLGAGIYRVWPAGAAAEPPQQVQVNSLAAIAHDPALTEVERILRGEDLASPMDVSSNTVAPSSSVPLIFKA